MTLRKATDMQRSYKIRATDGEIGLLDQFYFDDRRWLIRYLVIETGGWWEGRNVLLPPVAIKSIDWPTRVLHVELTKRQVKQSPEIDRHKPVSRQHEIEYFNFYGWPYYWSESGLWGRGYQPSSNMINQATEEALRRNPELSGEAEAGDPHLRSSREIIGYHLKAVDGEIGHVEDLIIDDERWKIVHLVVNTRNWWHGRNVLISPEKVLLLDWAEAQVAVNLTQNQIRYSPDFNGSVLNARHRRPPVSNELF